MSGNLVSLLLIGIKLIAAAVAFSQVKCVFHGGCWTGWGQGSDVFSLRKGRVPEERYSFLEQAGACWSWLSQSPWTQLLVFLLSSRTLAQPGIRFGTINPGALCYPNFWMPVRLCSAATAHTSILSAIVSISFYYRPCIIVETSLQNMVP